MFSRKWFVTSVVFLLSAFFYTAPSTPFTLSGCGGGSSSFVAEEPNTDYPGYGEVDLGSEVLPMSLVAAPVISLDVGGFEKFDPETGKLTHIGANIAIDSEWEYFDPDDFDLAATGMLEVSDDRSTLTFNTPIGQQIVLTLFDDFVLVNHRGRKNAFFNGLDTSVAFDLYYRVDTVIELPSDLPPKPLDPYTDGHMEIKGESTDYMFEEGFFDAEATSATGEHGSPATMNATIKVVFINPNNANERYRIDAVIGNLPGVYETHDIPTGRFVGQTNDYVLYITKYLDESILELEYFGPMTKVLGNTQVEGHAVLRIHNYKFD
jgi:hypothetical protein